MIVARTPDSLVRLYTGPGSNATLLARTYSADRCVIPALSALCEREARLSLDEARQMGIEGVALVETVREDIHSRNLSC